MERSRSARAWITAFALVILGSAGFGLLDPQPARADGLDVLCGAFDPVAVDDSQVTSVPGAQITVDATAPDGTAISQIRQPLLPFGLVPNLDTGGPNFGDAMRSVNIDGDPGVDVSFGWGFRFSTARGVGSAVLLGPNPMDELFNDNFRLPDDYRNPFNLSRPYVSGVGADIYFVKASETAVTQHKVELGGIVDFINSDDSRTHLKVRIGLDARPGHSPGLSPRLPDQADISLLAEKRNDPTTALDDETGGTNYLGLGLEFRYEGIEDAADNPPLGLTVDVEIVDDAGNPIPGSDFLDLSLGLSNAPGDLAIGIRQRCTEDRSVSMSHLSLNRADANPWTNVDIDLHSLAGSGLPAVPGGPAGDVMTVAGAINGLPQLVDVIMMPETIGVTRSPDIAPILKLDGLLFAPDDPDTTSEQPLFFSGIASGIPHHVKLDAVFDNPVGNRFVNLRGAAVECGATPPTYPDPALPIYPPNCAGVADAALGSVEFVAQSFAPADTAAVTAVTEVAPGTQECSAGQGAIFGYRQDIRSDQGGLWRASGCAQGVVSAAVVMPRTANPTPLSRPRVTATITRAAPSDIAAVVGAVFVDGDDQLRVEASGRIVAAPAEIRMVFQPTVLDSYQLVGSYVETKSRNIFDLGLPPGLDVTLHRVRVAAGPVGQTPETLVYGTGSITDLPPHLRVEAVTLTSPSGKRLVGATAEACPTLPQGDPHYYYGGNLCEDREIPEDQWAAGRIQLDVANFLPDDPAGADVPDLSPVPAEAAYAGNWATVAYRSPRDDRPAGNFRANVRIAGVRRVDFDMSGTSDPSNVLYARTHVKTSLDLAAPLPRALVKAEVDGRTSTSAPSAAGFMFRGRGVLTPVPEHVEATFESLDSSSFLFEDTPFAFEWHASSPIALTYPYADLGPARPDNIFVQGPAPDLLTISGNVEIGNADGTGGIAPDGRITMTQAQDIATYRHITYAASDSTVVRAGAVISTAADRAPAGTANDRRTRVRAEVELPALPFEDPLVVKWTEVNNTIREVGAFLCEENEGCPGNKVTATFHRGKTLADDNRTDLAPPVPGPQTMGGVTPVFSSFSPGPDGFAEGVRGVVLTGGTVAGHLAVADIASISAVLGSTATVRVRTDSPPVFDCRPNPDEWPPMICTLVPDPFTVSLFARSSAAVPGVFADGTVDDLPNDIVGQFSETGGQIGDAQPWIWFNTESIDIESAPDLTDVGGESGGPRFDGMVLVGDQTRILPTTADQFTETEGPGVKARASIFTNTNGKTTLGFAANLRLHVPRHVEIWKPTLRSCGAGTATLTTCAQLEAYEAEVRTRVDVRVRTTADNLGFLTGRFEIDNGRQDYQGNVSLETIPGSLDARVDLVQNKRLPWTTVNLSYTTNVSPGDATLTVYDRCLPAYVGDITNTPQLGQRILPGQCITNQSDVNKVPNYDVTLRDIPAKLDFRARVAASESPQLGTPRELSTCPDSGYQGRGPTRIGYLHADLGFGPLDRDRDEDERFDIDVAVRTGRTGQDGDPDSFEPDTENSQAIATVSAEGELSGEMSAKVLNLGEEQAVGGFVRTLGAIFQACLDFDLPITVSFDDVRDLRVSMSGVKLSLFRNESADVEGHVGEVFFPQATTPQGWRCWPVMIPLGDYSCEGAPFARRDAGLTAMFAPFHIEIPLESSTGWQDVGLIDVTDQDPSDGCPDALTLCSMVAPANSFDTDDLGTDSAEILRPDGSSTATGLHSEMVLDPIWGTEKRASDFYGHGLAFFYDTLNEIFTFDLPDTMPEINAGWPRDPLIGSFSLQYGFQMDDNERADYATGSDGTRYEMYYRRVSDAQGGLSNSWQPELWAFHPGGEVRWIRRVGWHVGASIIGRGNHDVRISPHSDGSVTVRLNFDDNDEDNVARFDASGNGRVLNGRTTVPATDVSGRVNRVIVLALPAGSELQHRPAGGNTRRWYLGDGRTTGQVVNGGTMVRYSAPGTYYVIGVDYDSKGREVAQHAFVVTVS